MNILISIVQPLYHYLIRLRNYLFDHGLFRSKRVSVPVISVGNISFGGTGKTPVVIWIARQIKEGGFLPVVISRGYKRKSLFARIVSDTKEIKTRRIWAGDEPFLMAHKLKGIPVVVSRNRVRGAHKAIKRFKPDAIILDDGFQHRKIKRNVDIVLVDSPETLNNKTLLREPIKSLRRAHAILFTKYDQYKDSEDIKDNMVKVLSCPVFKSRFEPVFIRNDKGKIPADVLDKKTVWIIAGIGNPKYFEHTVLGLGSYISRKFIYRDHARYPRWRVKRIIKKFKNSSADYLLTTEKDWYKVKKWIPDDVPGFYLDIDMKIDRSKLLLKLIYDLTYLYKDEILE
ncbi:tetraacyldisaccharide 4'-kinase [candidate division KSB1 bacterium]